MSAELIPFNLPNVRRMAAKLSDLGYRVLRVHPNDKRPVGERWQERATDDPNTLDEWFKQGGPEFNIGIACGPQPNKINLVVIDVDTRHDGMENWAALVDINGHPDTATHITPTYGLHYFFDCPFEVTNANNLPEGIDVRGVGGQVVIPPSWRMIDGDPRHYEGKGGRRIDTYPVAVMPEWLQPLVRPIERSIERHPSQQRVPTPGVVEGADWLKEHWDWLDELLPLGYELVKTVGNVLYLRHPTATNEHSCTVDLDTQRMNAYSPNMPSYWRDRQINRDGSISWTPFDWFVGVTHGGDASAAAREINGRRGDSDGGRLRRAVGTSPVGDAENGSSHRLPVVAGEYWEASARNRHIFQAARASLVSPDALDLVVFAFQSLLIPPGYLLPRIVGGQQPLNFLACLVAGTGLFKTSTLDAARDLMGPFPPWVLQIGMGSGEGIGAMFLKDELEENDKGKKVKTGRLVRNEVRGVFFEADEGKAMSAAAKRHGATIIANLCKAWSGSTLGEGNSDMAARRHVLDRDYRVSALVNIQPSNFADLFSESNTGTGLTGRFMLSGTLDADIPDEEPEWPGSLEHPKLPDTPITLTIDASIIAEAKAEIRRRHRTSGLDTTLDAVAQNAAVISRMAGIACLMDDRRHITTDDWHVASLRAQTSAGCLDILDSWGAATESDVSLKVELAKLHVRDTVDDIRNRQAVARLAEKIRAVVADESWARGALRKKVTSSETRDRFNDALDLAVSNGWVKVVDGRVEKA